ncbi:unnamed protein product [Hermetia illucens]|uniref:Uncharacterized protein n=1 Tax=Hermetia illucens TaxID=343691 RepID=A0A7R8YQ85_HERIL|nr:uncharacterized protein LOC119646615 isoform X2 [Hermetia illucens]CAD7078134.1 unnamed protein product [Hermetia illucens]
MVKLIMLFAALIACVTGNCINGSSLVGQALGLGALPLGLGGLPLGLGGQRGLFGLNLGIQATNQVGQGSQNSTFGLGLNITK